MRSHIQQDDIRLAMMFTSQLRQDYESYITQQAAIAHYKSLVPSNLEKASNLAVANLYWYFKVRDESIPQEA